VRRQYLLEGYSYSFEPDVLVTEYSTRNRRQRALYTKTETVFNVSERLNLSELANFEHWVNVTLSNGADEFTGSYWDGDIEKTASLRIVDGYYTFEHGSQNDVLVSYQIDLQYRDMTDAGNIYDLATQATFTSEYYNLFEKMVNLNNFA
jgi:hypothetical protein